MSGVRVVRMSSNVPDGLDAGAGTLLRRLGQATRQCWSASPRLLLGGVLLSALSGFLPVAIALYTKEMLDGLTAGLMPWAAAIGVAACGIALLALQEVASYLDRALRRAIAEDVQGRLFTKVNAFVGLGPFENPRLHDELRLAQQAGNTAPAHLAGAGPRVVRALVQLAGFGVAVWLLWPPILALVLVAAVPAVIAEMRLARANATMERMITQTARRRHFYELLLTEASAAKELRIFGSGGFLYDKMMGALRHTHRVEAGLDRRQARIRVLLGLLGHVVTMAGLVLAVSLAAAGRITVGDVVLLLAALAGVQACVLGVVGDVSATYGVLLTYGSFRNVLTMPGDLPAGELPVAPLRSGIELLDVWFRYDEDGPWVLKGVSLTIPHGQSVGLVGENGAGKSTLVKLLCRFYDPQRGRILWDGTDLRDLRPDELRSRIGAVFQDFVRYDLSAAENIGMGRLSALDDQPRLREAAGLAEADGFLQALPNGYDTLLSRVFYADEQDHSGVGSTLSGGQWQRVALARSLLRDDADLLILDEPSSGLDANAEFRVHNTLRAHRAGRTSVLISHRLSAIRAADHIIVLHEGRVAESGTHDGLVGAGDGVYAGMYERQAAGYQ